MFDKTSHTKNTSNENGQFQFQFFNNKESISEPVSSLFCLFRRFLANLYFIEVLPSSKPISNGKPKVFLSKPDDTSSEEDERAEPVLSDQ